MSENGNETSATTLAPSDDLKIPKDYKEHFRTHKKVVTKFVDPCQEASKASMDCLNRNDYNRDKCLDFFEAYKECKKTWLEQRREDGLNGKNNKIHIST
ncbi:aerobic respiration-related protein [Pyrrhoderma noxium]|uniref:Cx9C motif-containing protein 4, mitochondrial n=1 Tax=Pyrrhoderma noxium TaxID=2282107 RepID=A0A286UJ23_9AGAM|nr:aerobic respiration-related protein [Pyrrhoderma noxium]